MVAVLGWPRQLVVRELGARARGHRGLALEDRQLLLAPPAALLRGGGLVAYPLEPHPDALRRGAGVVAPGLDPLALPALVGERALGLLAPGGDRGEQPLGLVALGAGGEGTRLRLGERGPCRARSVGRQRHAGLERLALDPLVQLGGLSLALQRAQPRARLALHVQRSRQVLLGPLQLQLGAAAALAVLPEPRRLLDHQAPLPWPREDDLLDLALGDDGMHLLAETGVREHLEHVHEPAARTVEPVLALAVTPELADDRDLGEVGGQRAVRVVDHDLHLGGP